MASKHQLREPDELTAAALLGQAAAAKAAGKARSAGASRHSPAQQRQQSTRPIVPAPAKTIINRDEGSTEDERGGERHLAALAARPTAASPPSSHPSLPAAAAAAAHGHAPPATPVAVAEPISEPLAPDDANGAPPVAAQEQKVQKVRKACFLCKNAHACCDYKRPCKRCVKLGMEDVCFDTEGKKRGRKSKAVKAAEAIMLASASAAHSPLALTFAPGAAAESDGPEDAEQDEAESDPAGSATQAEHSGLEPAVPAVKRRKPATRVPEAALTDVNRMLLNEIRELKADQERLYGEIRALKEQRQAAPAPAVSSPTPHPTGGAEQQAMVVYDLTKKPAVVQSANELFCSMLGYTPEEALGASWHKFVYAPYVERALNILAPFMVAKNGQSNASVRFDQIYQHKNGTLLRTLDSHSIFFRDGQPVSDVITVTFLDGPSPPQVQNVTGPTLGTSLSLEQQNLVPPPPPLELTMSPKLSTSQDTLL